MWQRDDDKMKSNKLVEFNIARRHKVLQYTMHILGSYPILNNSISNMKPQIWASTQSSTSSAERQCRSRIVLLEAAFTDFLKHLSN